VGAAADRFELAYLRLVPLTTSEMFAVASGANNQYFHNFFYDATGIAANAATQMVLAAGSMDNSAFTDFVFYTDGAQGPLIELDGTVLGLAIQNFLHFHNGGTLVISLLDVDGVGSTGIVVGPGHGQIGGGGAVTNLIACVDMTDAATNGTLVNFTGSVAYSTAAVVVEAATGVAAEFDIVNSWIATIAGGAGRAAYVGTT
jgi:hypothetical protein